MTLILAIPCKDGVVFASDGQATTLIDHEYTKSKTPKIFKLGKNVLWGCSGSEVDILRFWDTIGKSIDESKNCSLNDPRLRERLEEFTCVIIEEAEEQAEEQRKKTGIRLKLRCPEYLVVGHQKYPIIWGLVGDCGYFLYDEEQYEMIKHHMCSIGSGQTVPQALFNNLKYKNREYTLAQGSLIAYRLLKEAIKSSLLIGEPIDIWTIKNNKVKQKTNAELLELEVLYNTWIKGEQLMFKAILSDLK